jgi:hypothetical protein
MAKKDNELFDRLTAAGMRKKLARKVSRAVDTGGAKANGKIESLLGELESVVGEVRDRVGGRPARSAPGGRSAAASSAAATKRAPRAKPAATTKRASAAKPSATTKRSAAAAKPAATTKRPARTAKAPANRGGSQAAGSAKPKPAGARRRTSG